MLQHKMAPVQLSGTSFCLLLLTLVPGVHGLQLAVAGIVAAGTVAFIMLLVIIGVVIVGLTCKSWYPSMKADQGKVKMPASYWKKKKEVKQRLINASRSTTITTMPRSENGVRNGGATLMSRVHDTGPNPASWVQGWNNVNAHEDIGYEEMALAMDLGEEREEPEFRIETTVVEDETLDLGPFKATTILVGKDQSVRTSEQTATMEMADELKGEGAIYARVDRPRRVPSLGVNPRQVSSSDTPPAPPAHSFHAGGVYATVPEGVTALPKSAMAAW